MKRTMLIFGVRVFQVSFGLVGSDSCLGFSLVNSVQARLVLVKRKSGSGEHRVKPGQSQTRRSTASSVRVNSARCESTQFGAEQCQMRFSLGMSIWY
ncbi:hypothetical protein Hdeb2414_s0014g00424011 [Helianthus debilis subsp. tardiflorus]